MMLEAVLEAYLRRLFEVWARTGNHTKNVSIELEPDCKDELGNPTPWVVCVLGEENFRTESWSLDQAFEEMIAFGEEQAAELERGDSWD